MLRWIVAALALGMPPVFVQSANADDFPPTSDGQITVGPFALVCRPNPATADVTCLAHLAAVLVVARVMTATAPNFSFNVAAGNATAKGHLSAIFLPSDQLSTIEANFEVTAAGQKTQIYSGAFTYWHSLATSPRSKGTTATQPRAHPRLKAARAALASRKTP